MSEERRNILTLRGTIVCAVLLTIGCRSNEVTSVASDQLTAQPRTTWNSSTEYPTEEEYLSEVPSGAEAEAGNPVSSFNAAKTQFRAEGSIAYRYVNFVAVALKTKLLDSTGAQLNVGNKSYGINQIPPVLSQVTVVLKDSISTVYHHCSVVGKATPIGNAKAFVLRGADLLTLWDLPLEENAPDLALPECPPPENCTYTTLRAASQHSPSNSSRQENAAVFGGGSLAECASSPPGGTGEGGDPPAMTPEDYYGNCHYERDFWIVGDGSGGEGTGWGWLDAAWRKVCGYATVRASSMASSRSSSSRLRLRLLGTGRLASGRAVLITRDTTSRWDALIAVDTTRATAADLELAMLTAEDVATKPLPNRINGGRGAVVGPIAPTSTRFSTERAAKFLKKLKTSDDHESGRFDRGRGYSVQIDRQR